MTVLFNQNLQLDLYLIVLGDGPVSKESGQIDLKSQGKMFDISCDFLPNFTIASTGTTGMLRLLAGQQAKATAGPSTNQPSK